MLSKKRVLEAIKAGRQSRTHDVRDYARLIDFFETDKWHHFGFEVIKNVPKPEPKEWTRENIIAQFRKDVAFGFEKALDQRAVSSGAMYHVVKMWLWILEDDELFNLEVYAQYGLQFFKACALKYGFENPIGDDTGAEQKYAM